MNKDNDAIKEFSKFFSPSKIENILTMWKGWHEKDTDALVQIFPTTPKDISLFTLPSEKPRYSSTLLGLSIGRKQILELGWEAYSKGLYKKSLANFSDMQSDNGSPDIKNGLAWSYLKNKEIKTHAFFHFLKVSQVKQFCLRFPDLYEHTHFAFAVRAPYLHVQECY